MGSVSSQPIGPRKHAGDMRQAVLPRAGTSMRQSVSDCSAWLTLTQGFSVTAKVLWSCPFVFRALCGPLQRRTAAWGVSTSHAEGPAASATGPLWAGALDWCPRARFYGIPWAWRRLPERRGTRACGSSQRRSRQDSAPRGGVTERGCMGLRGVETRPGSNGNTSIRPLAGI